MPATDLPAGVLPVSVTARTSRWRMIGSTREPSTSSVVKTCRGKPACSKISWIANAQPETFEACLSRPTLPAMSAGAAKRNTCQNGKFHGMTARITPSGSQAT